MNHGKVEPAGLYLGSIASITWMIRVDSPGTANSTATPVRLLSPSTMAATAARSTVRIPLRRAVDSPKAIRVTRKLAISNRIAAYLPVDAPVALITEQCGIISNGIMAEAEERNDTGRFDARSHHGTAARARSAAALRTLPVAGDPRRRAHLLLRHDPGGPTNR